MVRYSVKLATLYFNSFREWPQPVLLKKADEDVLQLNLPVWNPRVNSFIISLNYFVSFSPVKSS